MLRALLELLPTSNNVAQMILAIESMRLGEIEGAHLLHCGPGRGAGRYLYTVDMKWRFGVRKMWEATMADWEDIERLRFLECADDDPPSWRNLLWWTEPSLDERIAAINLVCDDLIARASRPHRELPGAYWTVDGLDPKLGEVIRFRSFQWQISTLMSARDRFEASRIGLRLMIAIELFRGDVGRVPESLDELVTSGQVEQLPIDPLNGSPFGCRVLTDDEHGRPYLLYSFASDGVDNGGIEQSADDILNSTLRIDVDQPAEEFDIVINQPLPVWNDVD